MAFYREPQSFQIFIFSQCFQLGSISSGQGKTNICLGIVGFQAFCKCFHLILPWENTISGKRNLKSKLFVQQKKTVAVKTQSCEVFASICAGFVTTVNCGYDALWFDTSSFLCLTSSVKKWLLTLVWSYHPFENLMYALYHFLRKRNCHIHNVCLHTEQLCMANNLKFYFKMSNILSVYWHSVNQKTPESNFLPEQ